MVVDGADYTIIWDAPVIWKNHHTWRVSSKSPLSSNNFNLLIATADVYGFSMTSSWSAWWVHGCFPRHNSGNHGAIKSPSVAMCSFGVPRWHARQCARLPERIFVDSRIQPMVARPKNGRMEWSKQNGNVFFLRFHRSKRTGNKHGGMQSQKQVSGKLSK